MDQSLVTLTGMLNLLSQETKKRKDLCWQQPAKVLYMLLTFYTYTQVTVPKKDFKSCTLLHFLIALKHILPCPFLNNAIYEMLQVRSAGEMNCALLVSKMTVKARVN